ncbi:DUF4199 domain-containing protein [Spongiimicrobium salis]|uniref:DUF4199 domain-containing protein n=1 Tax=Spongiimicrobium salis TaxID=1667022 RepID=UPI00374DF597
MMQKTILKYGSYSLITAALLFLAALVLGKELDYTTQAALGYLSMVTCLIFVYFGIKHYRDKENNGVVSFGRALSIGLLISVFAGIGFGCIDYLYTTVINPDFMKNYIEASGEADMPEYSSFSLAAVMFMTVFVIGFIISLISSLILQRKTPS